jgi:hypothetical protein
MTKEKEKNVTSLVLENTIGLMKEVLFVRNGRYT